MRQCLRPQPSPRCVKVVGEIRKIEMAVAVDKHRFPTVQAASVRYNAEKFGRRAPTRCLLDPAQRRPNLRNRAGRPEMPRMSSSLASQSAIAGCARNGNLADHFGGYVQHGSLALRICLRQCPRRLTAK